jgi:hypothetical protein
MAYNLQMGSSSIDDFQRLHLRDAHKKDFVNTRPHIFGDSHLCT